MIYIVVIYAVFLTIVACWLFMKNAYLSDENSFLEERLDAIDKELNEYRELFLRRSMNEKLNQLKPEKN